LIRTPKIPFIHSRASWQLALLTTLGIATGTIIPYTWLGKQLDMHHLPPVYYLWLVGTIYPQKSTKYTKSPLYNCIAPHRINFIIIFNSVSLAKDTQSLYMPCLLDIYKKYDKI
jgi:hypothetical protein